MGMHFDIDSPTTIIATANPYNATWNKGFMMSKEEIPTLKTFLDRCDQVYGFRDAPSEDEIKEYTIQKTILRKRKPHNYHYLRKYLTFVRTINPTMTSDAEDRLNKFWIKAKIENTVTNRTYDSIFRLAEAQARLNLSHEVSDEISTQTMESISLMLSQYGKIVDTVESPKDITYRAFFYILKQTKAGLSVSELSRIACDENKHVSEYLGDKCDMERNHKIEPIVDMLLNYHGKNIKIVKMKPTVLQYIDDDNSVSDATDTLPHQQSEKEISLNETASDTLDRSDSDEHIDYSKQANNQSYSILTCPSAEKNVDDVFWQRFDELEKESDYKLVDHQILKENIVSSGKFYVGDAHHYIENMVKSGKIIEVGFDKYKKRYIIVHFV
jgi:MCM AAA-lid domain